MKHEDGVHVCLLMEGKQVKEFANPLEKRCDDFKGAFGSRLIAAAPGEPFELVIGFDTAFKVHSADGILIAISTNPYNGIDGIDSEQVQCIWLDSAHMNIRKDHHITEFTLWSSDDESADTKQVKLQIPAADPSYEAAGSEWMSSGYYCANPGCVSIQLLRAKFKKDTDEFSGYRRDLTEPPYTTRYRQSSKARVIRSEWFRALDSDNGLPYLFEYRAMSADDRNSNHLEAASEIGHDSDLEEGLSSGTSQSEDEDGLTWDTWGLEDYDPSADSDYSDRYTTFKKRKYRGSQEKSKKQRATDSLVDNAGFLARVCTSRTKSEDRDDDEDDYLKPESEVKVERVDDRFSIKQNPTPPKEYARTEESADAAAADNMGRSPRVTVPAELQHPGAIELKSNEGNIVPVATPGVDQQVSTASTALKTEDEVEDIEDLRDELEETNYRAHAVSLRRRIRTAGKKAARMNVV